MADPLTTAERFASALDREDYAAAEACLAPDCEYHIRGMVHAGPAAILASYRAAGEGAAARFDSVRYESSVRPAPDGGAVIGFVDHLERRGERHTHRCEQRLSFDASGRIRRIEHVDLPGEREALAAFLAGAGPTPE